MSYNYVHGYTDFENQRLDDQASTLEELLHADSCYPEGAQVLEAGCGTGAQTVILCRKNPDIHLTSIDISVESLRLAKERCHSRGLENVRFMQADIYQLPFETFSFDHLFICFVLEHLADVDGALTRLKPLIRPGGTITVIEGDHGSAYFHPQSILAQQTINCLIDLQYSDGGDSLIGRRLFPLLNRHGFRNVRVSPRMVYADASLPRMVDGFTRKTFIAMVEGVKERAVQQGLMTEKNWDKGIQELKESASEEGVFCYTFFKATASI